MNIIEKRLEELIEYENNPRNNEEAVEKVVASIEMFGFKVPIVIDKDNVIIAGHTRRKAAEKLGLETVPCIVADDLTEEQVKAFRLADNKVSEFAEWDTEKLEEETEKLTELERTIFGLDIESNFDASPFFEDVEMKEKEPKTVLCPHCGGVNEV